MLDGGTFETWLYFTKSCTGMCVTINKAGSLGGGRYGVGIDVCG